MKRSLVCLFAVMLLAPMTLLASSALPAAESNVPSVEAATHSTAAPSDAELNELRANLFQPESDCENSEAAVLPYSENNDRRALAGNTCGSCSSGGCAGSPTGQTCFSFGRLGTCDYNVGPLLCSDGNINCQCVIYFF
ncbi:MAG: hypothetical protein AAGD01_19315 [Acidobacteriota bacterium]